MGRKLKINCKSRNPNTTLSLTREACEVLRELTDLVSLKDLVSYWLEEEIGKLSEEEKFEYLKRVLKWKKEKLKTDVKRERKIILPNETDF